MKILMVTPYVPYPPSSGGQIRTFNLLKYLSKRNYIVLVALYKKDSEKEYLSALKQYCDEVYLCKRPEKPWQLKTILKALFTLKPFLIARNFSHEAQHTIEQLLKDEKFDVIHSETFYVMPHLPATKTPVFLVEQTIEFEVYQHFVDSLPFILRPILYIDILKLRYWEKFYWKRATLMATVSNTDRDTVMKVAPELDPVVIPNGAGEDMVIERLGKKPLNQLKLLFQGNFSWLQNVEAAEFLINSVYPTLRKNFPHMQLIIAGQHAKKIKRSHPEISIVEIPIHDTQTVIKLYKEAYLFIAPIFGPGGTRLKLLAAMACGLPIISTKTGVSGLDVTDGENVLLANTPDEFASQIRKIIEDKDLYNSLRESAHTLILKKYSWKVIAKELENTYLKIKP
ncbi:MAG: glycosyltransferase family 4 protein [Microgenomates group bacterium]|jgi:glycosyltransferase involved in cell wall biosynthesis|nr:glycosyltransferase family 4 protein [Candidatus Woesebacteria bacterium]MBP6882914.1 glycosyltransferase family 4 protein [Candidatus Woesebacteria bacterium]QQR63465.1 MAG: glycosyltransferase family 4 protein [Candidatus Roizmanbacteria bacterium]